MADQILNCSDCPGTFVFTERDQEFYASKSFANPKRCKPCREKHKARNAERTVDAPSVPSPQKSRGGWTDGTDAAPSKGRRGGRNDR